MSGTPHPDNVSSQHSNNEETRLEHKSGNTISTRQIRNKWIVAGLP